MEKIIEILEDVQDGIDYRKCKNLVDGHYLDSLSILALVTELEDEFDISIPAVDIIPSNFNSVENIYAMVERLLEE